MIYFTAPSAPLRVPVDNSRGCLYVGVAQRSGRGGGRIAEDLKLYGTHIQWRRIFFAVCDTTFFFGEVGPGPEPKGSHTNPKKMDQFFSPPINRNYFYYI